MVEKKHKAGKDGLSKKVKKVKKDKKESKRPRTEDDAGDDAAGGGGGGSGGEEAKADKEPKKRKFDTDKKSAKGKKDKFEPEIAHDHKEQKALKLKRKAERNPLFSAIQEAKVYWEKLRGRNCPKGERPELVNKVMALVEGKMHDIIFQHDSVRILQCCMQYGTMEQRSQVFDELEPYTLDLAKSKYGKFMIPKMLTYGTREQRNQIIKQFYGHVRKLIKHKAAAPVLSLAYIDFATSEQRSLLLQEFYGPDFALFKTTGNLKSIEEIFAKFPDKKDLILKHLKNALVPLLEKGICAHHIVHRALHDFLSHATEVDRSEMVDIIQELLVEMLHTRDGALVTLHCIWNSNAKTRKIIVRSMNAFVPKICMEEYGYRTLCALFDAVDDTVLLNKKIIAPLLAEIDEISQDKFGRKTLMYLIQPRNPKYFIPEDIKLLATGDGNPHSKKSEEQRRTELRKTFMPQLIKHIAENATAMVTDGPSSLLVTEALGNSKDVAGVSECVDAVVVTASIKEDTDLETTCVMCNLVGHKMVQRLLKEDSDVAEEMAQKLWAQVEGSLQQYIKFNRANFALLALYNGVDKGVSKDLVTALKACDGSAGTGKGWEILQERMAGKAAPARPAKGAPAKKQKKKGTA